ncbi:hypothetical protein HYH03_004901 [Edaphochlamys debaryana]|uniref:PPIase cyclophilin-type domain-containing protein n=1 Tax=Edaphochlamys debaryana TaxID=47281 RepID=A0A835Y6G5_9CHLO|nr:hypothetical protein HYH03_004901 [Edaphochlamys debaryana]|eukprot:KAG2496893.1 hypothetical protein HYH03_004901 [Edaphochlamys debaryana]
MNALGAGHRAASAQKATSSPARAVARARRVVPSVQCAARKEQAEAPLGREGLMPFFSALASSALLLGMSSPAFAVLNSPNAQIPRSPDAALRRAIPAFNPEVKRIQKNLEDVQYLMRIPQNKPWASMSSSVADALKVTAKRDVMLAGVPPASLEAAGALLDSLNETLLKLQLALGTKAIDAVSIRVANCLEVIGNLELLQAPGLRFVMPKDYTTLPRLVGRAVVELTLERGDGSAGFVDPSGSGPAKQGKMVITVDGYSAPLSAGNFIKNVQDGLYNNRTLNVNYTSVFVTGSPEQQRPPIPLEILPAGEFEPLYRIPLDVQSGELPVLPLSISGAVTFAHLPDTDAYLSGTDWFVYKFDKQQAGLAGLAFDEGTFGVFGYVTEGLGTVTTLTPGDRIVEARVVSGADKLVLP